MLSQHWSVESLPFFVHTDQAIDSLFWAELSLNYPLRFPVKKVTFSHTFSNEVKSHLEQDVDLNPKTSVVSLNFPICKMGIIVIVSALLPDLVI